jgi:hypothetical protein
MLSFSCYQEIKKPLSSEIPGYQGKEQGEIMP